MIIMTTMIIIRPGLDQAKLRLNKKNLVALALGDWIKGIGGTGAQNRKDLGRQVTD